MATTSAPLSRMAGITQSWAIQLAPIAPQCRPRSLIDPSPASCARSEHGSRLSDLGRPARGSTTDASDLRPDVSRRGAELLGHVLDRPPLRAVAFEARDSLIPDRRQGAQQDAVIEGPVRPRELLLAWSEVQPVDATAIGTIDVPNVVIEELL